MRRKAPITNRFTEWLLKKNTNFTVSFVLFCSFAFIPRIKSTPYDFTPAGSGEGKRKGCWALQHARCSAIGTLL